VRGEQLTANKAGTAIFLLSPQSAEEEAELIIQGIQAEMEGRAVAEVV
jgi:hypothetical protein